MTRNPLLNALAALLYIILITVLINFTSQMARHPNSYLGPMVGLSLFTLSAAVMGYLFCYQPIQLFLDGKRKEGVDLFLKTTLIFGCFTALILLLLFMGVFF